MLVQRLAAFLKGYLVFQVEGAHPERFLNLALTRGFLLWDTSRAGERALRAKAPASSFKAFRRLARQSGCRLKILKKRGLPFFLRRFRRRRMLLGGSLFFLLVVWLLSCFVWEVEVRGARHTSPRLLREFAARHGLRPGSWKYGIREKELSQALLQEFPDLAYAEVELKGTRAQIWVVEQAPRPRLRGPCHIVARRSGVVEEFLVLAGVPLVKEGDLVREGQVLISGVVTSPGKEGEQGARRLVEARGVVRARVWYRASGEAAVRMFKTVKTGRVVRLFCMRLPGREIIIKGPRRIPFSSYRLSTKRRAFRWRSISLPVEFVTIRAEETRKVRLLRPYEEAARAATGRARRRLASLLPKGAVVARREEFVVASKEAGKVRAVVTVEVLEEIGEARAIRR